MLTHNKTDRDNRQSQSQFLDHFPKLKKWLPDKKTVIRMPIKQRQDMNCKQGYRRIYKHNQNKKTNSTK